MPRKTGTLIDFMATLNPGLSAREQLAQAKSAGFKTTLASISATRNALKKRQAELVPTKRSDNELAFLKIVARIGTDRARALLAQAEQREIS